MNLIVAFNTNIFGFYKICLVCIVVGIVDCVF